MAWEEEGKGISVAADDRCVIRCYGVCVIRASGYRAKIDRRVAWEEEGKGISVAVDDRVCYMV